MKASTTVKRQEIKYTISLKQAHEIYQKLSSFMEKDSYGIDGEYNVRSLYFDSILDGDLKDKLDGEYYKKKVRARIYDVNQETAKLEIKKKEGNFQKKFSLTCTKEEIESLIRGNYSFLLDKEDSVALELYRIMTLGAYRPKVIVEYKRKALTLKRFNTRVTFDHSIYCSELVDKLFEEHNLRPILIDKVILEVKFDSYLDEAIKRVLNAYGLYRLSYSKYEQSRIVE